MLFYTLLGIGLAAFFALKHFVSRRGLINTARQEYQYRQSQGHDVGQASEAAFARAYSRVYGARGDIFIAGTLFALSLLSWPLFKALELSLEYGWRWGGQDRAYEPGYLVWQFMLFGGVIVGWALIVYFGARIYHRSAPESLSAEIEKEKANGH